MYSEHVSSHCYCLLAFPLIYIGRRDISFLRTLPPSPFPPVHPCTHPQEDQRDGAKPQAALWEHRAHPSWRRERQWHIKNWWALANKPLPVISFKPFWGGTMLKRSDLKTQADGTLKWMGTQSPGAWPDLPDTTETKKALLGAKGFVVDSEDQVLWLLMCTKIHKSIKWDLQKRLRSKTWAETFMLPLRLLNTIQVNTFQAQGASLIYKPVLFVSIAM